MEAQLTGIERAIFGPVTVAEVDAWLDHFTSSYLGAGVASIGFRAGRLAPVYGLHLDDGRDVAAKIYLPSIDVTRLHDTVRCQGVLARAGFPCPTPLAGPTRVGGRVVAVETLLATGSVGDARDPAICTEMARSLAEQITILETEPVGSLARGTPAWVHFERGPWPVPHDPIFEFSRTPPEFAWLDEIARAASGRLQKAGPPTVLGHADWYCGNLAFDHGRLCAAYDWDSLIAHDESVLVGASAGMYTIGGLQGGAPTPADVDAFVRAYAAERGPHSLRPDLASAAATWVLAYNARCDVNNLEMGIPAGPESSLAAIDRYRWDYLASS